MPDVPAGVAEHLLTIRLTETEKDIASLRAGTGIQSEILRFSAVRRFDELGISEARAQTGLLATNVGGPTNAGGPANGTADPNG